jgi:hypothetical protein
MIRDYSTIVHNKEFDRSRSPYELDYTLTLFCR